MLWQPDYVTTLNYCPNKAKLKKAELLPDKFIGLAKVLVICIHCVIGVGLTNPVVVSHCLCEDGRLVLFSGSYCCFLLNGADSISCMVDSTCCKRPTASKWLLSNPYILFPYLPLTGADPSVAQGMDYLIRERLEHPPGSAVIMPVLLQLSSWDANYVFCPLRFSCF